MSPPSPCNKSCSTAFRPRTENAATMATPAAAKPPAASTGAHPIAIKRGRCERASRPRRWRTRRPPRMLILGPGVMPPPAPRQWFTPLPPTARPLRGLTRRRRGSRALRNTQCRLCGRRPGRCSFAGLHRGVPSTILHARLEQQSRSVSQIASTALQVESQMLSTQAPWQHCSVVSHASLLGMHAARAIAGEAIFKPSAASPPEASSLSAPRRDLSLPRERVSLSNCRSSMFPPVS